MFLRGLEGWHIVIIVLLIAVLFGAKRMPDAARSIGQSLRIFKSEVKAASTTDDSVVPTPAPVEQIDRVEQVDRVQPVPASHAGPPTQ